jgi:poly(A) polymerase
MSGETGELPRLKDQEWFADPGLRRVLEVLGGEAGEDTRIVGGAVRNALFDRPVKDIDLATRLSPREVLALAGKAGLKAIPTGIEHGTVTVVAKGRPFEVTTLRLDLETYGRHARVAFTHDWREDAMRRDFTINALYADAAGKIHDPLGGLPDVAAHHVRFIGDADARIGEDYLRVLRFFRLHAEYGEGPLDAEGLAASIRGRHGLAHLSAERLGQETRRLLAAPNPLESVEAMADTGIIHEMVAGMVYPAALEKLLEMENRLGLEADGTRRLAVLGCAVEEDADRLLARLRLSRAEYDRVRAATRGWRQLKPELGEDARKVVLYRAGREAFEDRVLMAWANRGSGAGSKVWAELFAFPSRWSVPELPWRGADLKRAGIGPGPVIGKVLKEAEARWIAAGFPEDPADLDRLVGEAASSVEKNNINN